MTAILLPADREFHMLNEKAVKLLQDALELDTDERAVLIARLTDSLHDQIDPAIEKAWIDECDQRWSKYQRGETDAQPLDDVLRDIRTRMNQS